MTTNWSELRERASRRGRIELEPGDYAYGTPSWEEVSDLLGAIDAAIPILRNVADGTTPPKLGAEWAMNRLMGGRG